MTNGIAVQAQSPSAAGADLGFWMSSQIVGQPMAMGERHLSNIIEAIHANRFTLPKNRKTGAHITPKGTAIVEMHGVLINRAPIMGSFWGMTAYEGLTEQFERLATNSDVKRIVLDINSPGGMVAGIQGCSEALEKLAAKKPVFALAHDQACSAAYWLGCIADEFFVTKDGEAGSIGVRAGHVSYAEMMDRAGIKVTMYGAGATKNDGNPYAQLSDGAFAETSYGIERINDRFVEHVASNRPLGVDAIRDTAARTFVGQDAVELQLADGVESLEEMVARIEKGKHKIKSRNGKTQPGSKAGLSGSGSERMPAKPDEDEPAARASPEVKPTGARLMTTEQVTSAEGNNLTAENMMAAIAAIAANRQEKQTSPESRGGQQVEATAEQRIEAAVTAERERIFAILESEAAQDRQALAKTLAKDASRFAPDTASTLLAAAAPEVAPKSEDDGNSAKDGRQAALDHAMARQGNAGNVRPEASEATRVSFVDFCASTAPGKNKKG